MKVLWFTNTPSNFFQGTNAYNGGGWISSLETELQKQPAIELGIAFLLNGHPQKIKRDGVCYYPIPNPYIGSITAKLKNYVNSSANKQEYFIKEYIRIIDDFAPNIIHVFGTEQSFGLVAKYTNIPIVIHIQGLLNPCLTAFFPPGYSKLNYFFSDKNPLNIYRRWKNYNIFRRNAEREQEIFRHNKHFIGRTAWDKNLTCVYSPQATYDYCGEILREVFYRPCVHSLPKRLTITTTISSPLYKGYDVVLKCAKILKTIMNLDFEWRVFGNTSPTFIERKEKICSTDFNVCLMGVASQETLYQSIAESTIYVHSSYIDNSPNSVCEAQILGCTVVAQCVGGVPSLVTDGETGFLVPANDPYQMACVIRDLYLNPIKNKEIGLRAKEIAYKRHAKDSIINDLLCIYQKYRSEQI